MWKVQQSHLKAHITTSQYRARFVPVIEYLRKHTRAHANKKLQISIPETHQSRLLFSAMITTHQ